MKKSTLKSILKFQLLFVGILFVCLSQTTSKSEAKPSKESSIILVK